MKRGLLYAFGLALSALAPFSSQSGGLWTARYHDAESPNQLTSWQNINCDISADFDGDNKPDLAVGRNSGGGYTVQIRFTSSIPEASLIFPISGPGFRIVARDVDHDDDQDIIITSATSDIPVAIWLSDGKGHFERGDPWAYFPQNVESPLRCQTGQPVEFAPGLTEDGCSNAGVPSGGPSIAELQAGALLAAESGRFYSNSSLSTFIPRGPPLTETLGFS